MTDYPYIRDNQRKYRNYQRTVALLMMLTALAGLSALKSDSFDTQAYTYQVHLSEASSTPLMNLQFVNVLERTEGYGEKFYPDNEGVAITYGWNITKNDRLFNRRVGLLLKLPESSLSAIEKYSGQKLKSVPPELQNITIKKSQTLAAADYMYHFYLDEFVQTFKQKNNPELADKINTAFSDNQRAVFAHMAYKVGRRGLEKYDNFYQKLGIILSKNKPSPTDMQTLSDEISYEFNYKGKKLRDARVEMIHRSAFAPQY